MRWVRAILLKIIENLSRKNDENSVYRKTGQIFRSEQFEWIFDGLARKRNQMISEHKLCCYVVNNLLALFLV